MTPLIAHISSMPGPIKKPFDSMKDKTGRIFLVYDKSSYCLYYPFFRYENVFDKVLPDMVSVCPHNFNFFYALS